MQCLSSRVTVIQCVELHRAIKFVWQKLTSACTEIDCHAKESINTASNDVFTVQVAGRGGPL